MEALNGRLTILADNRVPGKTDALGEHGFACYIETGKGSVLFDTGKGRTILHNSILFKKDLGAISRILLSHGHLDHTGGLPEVLRFHDEIRVEGHPDIFLDRFKEKETGRRDYMGLPFTKGYLERLGARFELNKDWKEIFSGLFMTGEVPRETEFEAADLDNRYAVRNGEVLPEIIMDDQSLVIQTANGLLILLGCAHAGMINIMNYAIKRTGIDDIVAVIGGTHLDFSDEAQLEETIRALKSYRIKTLIPSHCTGFSAISKLSGAFEKTFQYSHVGKSLEF